jgi:NhaA family Na+:H+ antiporter
MRHRAHLFLLGATVTALIWANSPWQSGYEHFRESLHFWVNDVLMAVFFLGVGLEIRHEFVEGDLRSLKMAALPLVAALGGVVVPAAVYLASNADPVLRSGWAIPTATDIAFAVAVFGFVGPRAPSALRALLLAIAVVDDIVAILVIAVFYAEGIAMGGLGIATAGVVFGIALRRIPRGWAVLHVVPASMLWFGLWRAGVHPALTGVVAGLLLPSALARSVGNRVDPWVVFVIMPLFALVNAGVAVQSLTLDWTTTARLAGGIVVALVVGKPVGIILSALLGVRLGWCELPRGVDFRRFAVIGLLGGIGFTMSLFVCNLAFTGDYLATAKLAVLLGSTLAAIGGLLAARVVLTGPAGAQVRPGPGRWSD